MDFPLAAAWLDELTTFLLTRPTEEEIIAFKPSDAVDAISRELNAKQVSELSEYELYELNRLRGYEHILNLLRAKARLQLATASHLKSDEKRQLLSALHEKDHKDINALYQMPVEILKLSEETLHIVSSTGIPTVGDWIDHFLRKGGAAIDIHPAVMEAIIAIEDEVKEKLAEHGYGTFD